MLPKLNPNLCLATDCQRKNMQHQEATKSKALQNKCATELIYLIMIPSWAEKNTVNPKSAGSILEDAQMTCKRGNYAQSLNLLPSGSKEEPESKYLDSYFTNNWTAVHYEILEKLPPEL